MTLFEDVACVLFTIHAGADFRLDLSYDTTALRIRAGRGQAVDHVRSTPLMSPIELAILFLVSGLL